MMFISRPATFRRRSTGISLFVWPAAMILAAVVQPAVGEDPASVYASAAAHPGRLAMSAAIGIVGVLAWIMGTAGLVHVIRQRAVSLGHLGGGLSLLGAVAHVIIATLFLVLVALTASADTSAMVDAVDRVANYVLPVAMPLLFLGAIGILLLGIAAWRDRISPIAVPLLIVGGILVEFLPLPGVVGDLLTWALVGVALGFAAVRILRMGDSVWCVAPPIDGTVDARSSASSLVNRR